MEENMMRKMTWGLVALACTSSYGIGYRPDPVDYQARLDAVVVEACKRFEQYDIHLASDRLKYGEHEIVDSFLCGRDTYRNSHGRTFPVEEKLGWLSDLLGERFPDLEIKWRRNVEELKKGCHRLSMEEIERRLNELRDGPPQAVKMDSGLCRSSSGSRTVEVECIHCGKRTVYPRIADNAYVFTPRAYLSLAEEMRRWGLDVDVDGRAACPDCCPFPCDFKLGEFPVSVKIRDDLELPPKRSVEYYRMGKFLPGIEIKVTSVHPGGKDGPSYDGYCIYPEAWVKKRGTCFDFYLVPDGRFIFGRSGEGVQYAEPREVVDVPGRGRFTKVLNVRSGRLTVESRYVTEVRRIRSSHLRSIPPTIFTINGRRFGASPWLADAIKAFVQGYGTVISGAFCDHIPLKQFEAELRSVLLPAPDGPAQRLKRTSLPDGGTRWTVDQDWYFSSFLPALLADLKPFEATSKEFQIPIEFNENGEAIMWDVLGTKPSDWVTDMEFGICAYFGKNPFRHFVVLVTSVSPDSATGKVYNLTGSDTWGFRRKWFRQIGCSDHALSSCAEFLTKDPTPADALVITPWLCRGTARSFITH